MGILDGLRNRLGVADEPMPREPPGFAADVEAPHDSADMMLAHDPDPEPLLEGLTVGIRYEDVDGKISDRLVNSIRLVHMPDGGFLWAYCHLCNDYRAFRLNRILRIRDYRTGRESQNPVAFFAPYASDGDCEDSLRTDVKSRSTREVLGLIGDELRILAYVALADRHFDAREEDLISQFVGQRVQQLDDEVVEHYDHRRVLDWVRSQKPSFSGLERAVERLSVRGEWELRALWDLSNDIVNADDHVDPDELRAMDELYDAIDRAVDDHRGNADREM